MRFKSFISKIINKLQQNSPEKPVPEQAKKATERASVKPAAEPNLPPKNPRSRIPPLPPPKIKLDIEQIRRWREAKPPIPFRTIAKTLGVSIGTIHARWTESEAERIAAAKAAAIAAKKAAADRLAAEAAERQHAAGLEAARIAALEAESARVSAIEAAEAHRLAVIEATKPQFPYDAPTIVPAKPVDNATALQKYWSHRGEPSRAENIKRFFLVPSLNTLQYGIGSAQFVVACPEWHPSFWDERFDRAERILILINRADTDGHRRFLLSGISDPRLQAKSIVRIVDKDAGVLDVMQSAMAGYPKPDNLFPFVELPLPNDNRTIARLLNVPWAGQAAYDEQCRIAAAAAAAREAARIAALPPEEVKPLSTQEYQPYIGYGVTPQDPNWTHYADGTPRYPSSREGAGGLCTG